MTYDQFWKGPPWLVRAYREAWDIHEHNEEAARWRQGLYIYTALRCAPLLVGFPDKGYKLPSDAGYPDTPFPLTEQEAKEREIMRENENTKRFIAQLEAESKRNLAKREAVKDGR